MEKPIFHIGDRIAAIERHRGLESAVITGIDKKYYHLKIPCGIGTIPIRAQDCYKLEK